MATSSSEIREWFEKGVEQGATHMIVVCDTYDYVDFPVYVSPDKKVEDEECRLETDRLSMNRIMEIYSLSQDMESQLKEERAFHRD